MFFNSGDKITKTHYHLDTEPEVRYWQTVVIMKLDKILLSRRIHSVVNSHRPGGKRRVVGSGFPVAVVGSAPPHGGRLVCDEQCQP